MSDVEKVGEVKLSQLPPKVKLALSSLHYALTRGLPDVKHVQITFDNVHSETPPTVQVLPVEAAKPLRVNL